eukprot:6516609-Pyramimonas_sp.AAC.1
MAASLLCSPMEIRTPCTHIDRQKREGATAWGRGMLFEWRALEEGHHDKGCARGETRRNRRMCGGGVWSG